MPRTVLLTVLILSWTVPLVAQQMPEGTRQRHRLRVLEL